MIEGQEVMERTNSPFSVQGQPSARNGNSEVPEYFFKVETRIYCQKNGKR